MMKCPGNLPPPDQLRQAAELLKTGGLVAVPTETVYGLAADAENDRAVARIFEAKGRPDFNPLIVHVSGLEMASRYADIPAAARRLAKAFWPGPLTMVLPRCSTCPASLLVSAGLPTIALRSPAAPAARTLLEKLGHGFAAPSANPSGQLSPTTADHVGQSLGEKVDLILDGGPSEVGIESTIVQVEADRLLILRPGSVAADALAAATGQPVESAATGAAINAPGMLESHYAPAAALRLNAETATPGEAFLAFGLPSADTTPTLNLSPSGNLTEAAANLFSFLHRLDRNHDRIAVASIPDSGIGRAINDRLKRAAAPRSRA